VTVTRNARWWGHAPRLSKIIFKAYSATAANRAFVHHRLDYDFDVAVDQSDYRTISHAHHGHATLAAGPDVRQFTVNSRHDRRGFMKDVKVRQAVELASNRNTLIKADLRGIPWPTVPLNNHFFVNAERGYRNDMGQLGAYDPTRADQILEADGFTKDSSGYYAKGGHEIDLDFMIPSGITPSRNEGLLTQAMLKQAGIKLRLNSVPINKWATKYLLPGRFDIAPFSWLGTAFPVSSARSIYLSPRHGGTQNFTGTANPAADRFLQRALRASTPAREVRLANKADRLLYQEVHTITLFERPQLSGVANRLANLGSFGFADVDYTKIGWMK
jgi:peptide/nickel transport system substrate-binding protein